MAKIGRSITPLLFSPPAIVAAWLAEMIGTGELQAAAKVTNPALFVGYIRAVFFPFGILIGIIPRFGDILHPYLFRSSPRRTWWSCR